MNTPTKVLTAQTANGASTVPILTFGAPITFLLNGTFGGATVTVEVSPDGGTTWVPTTLTATAAGQIEWAGGTGLQLQLLVSGATGTTSINAWVAYHPRRG